MSGIAIITEACIDVKDRACVNVCPVQCIYEFDQHTNVLFPRSRQDAESSRTVTSPGRTGPSSQLQAPPLHPGMCRRRTWNNG
jgi:NAD-dependent dihydropyrimidine dehydrogenase PreA subunit